MYMYMSYTPHVFLPHCILCCFQIVLRYSLMHVIILACCVNCVFHQKLKTFVNESDQKQLNEILQNDNNWIKLVLEVIGLMCDGQHSILQDYLRDQPDNFKVKKTRCPMCNVYVCTKPHIYLDCQCCC